MNAELFAALEQLEKEKGIPQEFMLEKIEAALTAAFKKEYGSNALVRIVLDPEKKDIKVYQVKNVVAEVEDPETEISLEEAKAHNKRMTVGKALETEVKTKNFRRLSAVAAKSVIVQGIREAEKRRAQEAYESKREEIITATVFKIDSTTGNVVIETGNGYAVLRKEEQIPEETFYIGEKIKVFVMEVNREMTGPLVTLSRSHTGMLRRLFELEVPEIADGTIVIKSVAREAGSRSKIAVYTENPDIDPIGSCIGTRGMRINAIVDELAGEKIDVVRYSEEVESYIASALAPAKIEDVYMTGERSAHVVVKPEQLSLAIGLKGQNARLAARLTGCKIDIKTE